MNLACSIQASEAEREMHQLLDKQRCSWNLLDTLEELEEHNDAHNTSSSEAMHGQQSEQTLCKRIAESLISDLPDDDCSEQCRRSNAQLVSSMYNCKL